MESIPELADVPVIFISGYRRDETVAKALDAGAADYIVKPFSSTELVARVHAALRREADTPDTLTFGDLVIDYETRRVMLAWPSRATHGHRIRSASGAVAQLGPSMHLRYVASPSVGVGGLATRGSCVPS